MYLGWGRGHLEQEVPAMKGLDKTTYDATRIYNHYIGMLAFATMFSKESLSIVLEAVNEDHLSVDSRQAREPHEFAFIQAFAEFIRGEMAIREAEGASPGGKR